MRPYHRSDAGDKNFICNTCLQKLLSEILRTLRGIGVSDDQLVIGIRRLVFQLLKQQALQDFFPFTLSTGFAPSATTCSTG